MSHFAHCPASSTFINSATLRAPAAFAAAAAAAAAVSIILPPIPPHIPPLMLHSSALAAGGGSQSASSPTVRCRCRLLRTPSAAHVSRARFALIHRCPPLSFLHCYFPSSPLPPPRPPPCRRRCARRCVSLHPPLQAAVCWSPPRRSSCLGGWTCPSRSNPCVRRGGGGGGGRPRGCSVPHCHEQKRNCWPHCRILGGSDCLKPLLPHHPYHLPCPSSQALAGSATR